MNGCAEWQSRPLLGAKSWGLEDSGVVDPVRNAHRMSTFIEVSHSVQFVRLVCCLALSEGKKKEPRDRCECPVVVSWG